MDNLTLLYSRIDAAINELIDLDYDISKVTGRTVGFATLKNIKRELGNNARKAVDGS